jgi:hypothetical protein
VEKLLDQYSKAVVLLYDWVKGLLTKESNQEIGYDSF